MFRRVWSLSKFNVMNLSTLGERLPLAAVCTLMMIISSLRALLENDWYMANNSSVPEAVSVHVGELGPQLPGMVVSYTFTWLSCTLGAASPTYVVNANIRLAEIMNTF